MLDYVSNRCAIWLDKLRILTDHRDQELTQRRSEMLHVSLPVVCVLDARHEKSIVEISCLLRACHKERVDLESIAYEFTLVILNDKVKRIGELRLESSH